jgi:NAD(P)H-nitrite reductase large subunit
MKNLIYRASCDCFGVCKGISRYARKTKIEALKDLEEIRKCTEVHKKAGLCELSVEEITIRKEITKRKRIVKKAMKGLSPKEIKKEVTKGE